MKKQIILLFFFAVNCIVFESSGQENPYNEVSIASPTAASLGKYADIPVNNHTGIPNIGLPIYTVEEGSLKLPISLSYHAGGIKVMEPASWVGTGWSLNAGGVITRAVRGGPDEKHTSSIYNQEYGYFSDYGFTSYSFYQPGLEAPDFMVGRRDGEPDLFSFNVNGLSGKFYFRDDRTAVFEPQQDIKVEYDYTEGQGSIKSFVLTAPDGTRYHFGTRNDTAFAIPVERTNTVTAQSGYVQGTVISSWYLSKIESADRLDFITLKYVAENYSYYAVSMFPLSPQNYRMNSSNYQINPQQLQEYEYNLIKNVVSGVRLSEINFSNGKVKFLSATSPREDLGSFSTSFDPEVVNSEASALGTVQIENNSTSCKKYVFSYEYFVDNTALQGYFAGYSVFADKKRLKLTALQELSCNNAITIPAHTFDYFSELLPRRLSFGQDHWGFYNGVTTNTKLIPTYTVNKWTVFPGANREPVWPAMRGGALQKINYPTGGHSLFEFEPNDTWAESTSYNDVYATNISVGYENSNNVNTETYTFENVPYTVYLTNENTGGLATLTVTNTVNGSPNTFFILNANPGESKQLTQDFPAGECTITISKNNVNDPYGAGGTFYKKVSYVNARNEIVGGLRIKTITHNDGGPSPDMVTSYSYLKDSLRSSGVLYSRPAYVQLVRSDEIKEAGMGGPYGNGSPTNNCSTNGCIDCDLLGLPLSYFKSPCAVRPLSTSQGNHIGYNQVKVSKTDNGHSIYKYFGSEKWDNIIEDIAIRNVNTAPPCSLSTPSYPYAPEPFDPKRGELKYEGHFAENGQRVKEADYTVTFVEEPTTTPGRIMGSYLDWGVTTYYELKPIRKAISSVVEKLYSSPTSYITTSSTTYFESSHHYQPTRTSTTNSLAQTMETKLKYAADFRNAACDLISDCWASYATTVGLITMQYYLDKAACTTSGCVWNNYQTYRAALATARRSYLECRRNYLDPDYENGFAKCRNDAKTDADSELEPIYELIEENNFVPIEKTEWKNGKLVTAVFNRFDYVVNPSGKVYLDKTQTINLREPSTTFSASTVVGNSITKDSRYMDEATVKFDAGNIVQIVKKDGVVTTYLWGYGGKYPVAKILNVSYDVAKTYVTASVLNNPSSETALRDHLNLLRGIPNSQVFTYTYKPLVGISSETDPRSKTIYYEYDDLNRLLLIRDHDSNILKKVEYKFQTTTQQ